MSSQACARGNLFRQKFKLMLEEWNKKNKVEAKKIKEKQNSEGKEQENSSYKKEVSSLPSIKTEDSSIPVATEAAEVIEPAQPPPRRKPNLQVHFY